jgi:hypothetical protein
MNRRDLLKVAGSTAGGVVIGTTLLSSSAAAVEFDFTAQNVSVEKNPPWRVTIEPDIDVRWANLDSPAQNAAVTISEKTDDGLRKLGKCENGQACANGAVSGTNGQIAFNFGELIVRQTGKPLSSGGTQGSVSIPVTLVADAAVETGSETYTRSDTASFTATITPKGEVTISGQANTDIR